MFFSKVLNHHCSRLSCIRVKKSKPSLLSSSRQEDFINVKISRSSLPTEIVLTLSLSPFLHSHLKSILSNFIWCVIEYFFRFFAIKPFHFIVDRIVFIYWKHSSFTARIRNEEKARFGRIETFCENCKWSEIQCLL